MISIGGSLEISENNSLESLNGLNNIEGGTISDLIIKFNPFLSYCHVQSICSYLSSPNGDIAIFSNLQGCNNYLEITNLCTVSTFDPLKTTKVLFFFPNPTKQSISVANHNELEELKVIIYNQTGQELVNINYLNSPIDISSINSGLYIIEIVSGTTRIRDKLIIK